MNFENIRKFLLNHSEKPIYIEFKLNSQIFPCFQILMTKEDLPVEEKHYMGLVPSVVKETSGSIRAKEISENMIIQDNNYIPVIVLNNGSEIFNIKETKVKRYENFREGREIVILTAGSKIEKSTQERIAFSMSHNS